MADLRSAMREKNVYKGRVVSLSIDPQQTLQVNLHRLPPLEREDVVLPEGVLERIERHTIGFATHSVALREAGRHIKRGLLLHGPPGTGKTLTAMYLASHMSDRTVLLLTGRAQGLIEQSCRMARALEPSMVILEDVDLVAEERTRATGCTTPILFELLNEMDGLGEDMDVIFLLTTNRPELLEPALACRPGRVDLAVEIPLPDISCRRRLFELYGKGLTLDPDDAERFAARCEGASAAFIRELLRSAALSAVDAGDGTVISGEHLDTAMYELAVLGGGLTRSLLGAGEELGS